MHKIDGPGAAPGNVFTEGNKATGVPATDVTDDWLNAVQAELVAVATSTGAALNKPDNTQVLTAILALVRTAKPIGQVITGYWSAAPAGTVLLVGAEVSRTTYAALWAHAQAIGAVVSDAAWATDKGKFSSGNGNTTFRLPDLADEFIRVRGASRVLGSKEADSLKAHNHGLLDSAVEGSNDDVQAFGQPGGTLNGLSSRTQDTGGTETRPRNVGLLAAMYY